VRDWDSTTYISPVFPADSMSLAPACARRRFDAGMARGRQGWCCSLTGAAGLEKPWAKLNFKDILQIVDFFHAIGARGAKFSKRSSAKSHPALQKSGRRAAGPSDCSRTKWRPLIKETRQEWCRPTAGAGRSKRRVGLLCPQPSARMQYRPPSAKPAISSAQASSRRLQNGHWAGRCKTIRACSGPKPGAENILAPAVH